MSCSICWDDLNFVDNTVISIDPCMHDFHYACISSWIKQSKHFTCPMCRGTFKEYIRKPSGDYEDVKTLLPPPKEVVPSPAALRLAEMREMAAVRLGQQREEREERYRQRMRTRGDSEEMASDVEELDDEIEILSEGNSTSNSEEEEENEDEEMDESENEDEIILPDQPSTSRVTLPRITRPQRRRKPVTRRRKTTRKKPKRGRRKVKRRRRVRRSTGGEREERGEEGLPFIRTKKSDRASLPRLDVLGRNMEPPLFEDLQEPEPRMENNHSLQPADAPSTSCDLLSTILENQTMALAPGRYFEQKDGRFIPNERISRHLERISRPPPPKPICKIPSRSAASKSPAVAPEGQPKGSQSTESLLGSSSEPPRSDSVPRMAQNESVMEGYSNHTETTTSNTVSKENYQVGRPNFRIGTSPSTAGPSYLPDLMVGPTVLPGLLPAFLNTEEIIRNGRLYNRPIVGYPIQNGFLNGEKHSISTEAPSTSSHTRPQSSSTALHNPDKQRITTTAESYARRQLSIGRLQREEYKPLMRIVVPLALKQKLSDYDIKVLIKKHIHKMEAKRGK